MVKFNAPKWGLQIFLVSLSVIQHLVRASESSCQIANFEVTQFKDSPEGSRQPTEYEGCTTLRKEQASERLSSFNFGSQENRDSILYLVFVSKSLFGSFPIKERKCIALWIDGVQEVPNACEVSISVENTTSSSAKKLLYEEALKLDLNGIQYLVMVDGSSHLIEPNDYGFSAGDPWSTFERYLLEWEPAVGVPRSLGSDYTGEKEVQEIFNYDQAVVAFHIEASPLLLPFWQFVDDYDDDRWLPSGTAQATIAHAAFQHHVVQFNALRVLQPNVPSKGKPPHSLKLKKYVMWAASAFRRLDDFLRIPWDRVDEIGVDQGNPLPRKLSRRSQYCITNSLGYFDECHPYFLSRNGYKRSSPITGNGKGTCNRFSDFPAVGRSLCVDSSQPNQGRYEQRLYLYIQELFFQLQGVIAVSEGGDDSGFCPHHPPEELRLQISSPQMGDSFLERDIRGVHIVATGLPRWSLELEQQECSRGLDLDNILVGRLCINEVCKNKGLGSSSSQLVHSKRGWPPVQWHCTKYPKGVAVELKQKIAGIQADGTYNLTMTIWSNCSWSGSAQPADFLLIPQAYCNITATDSALFNIEFAPSEPFHKSKPNFENGLTATEDLHLYESRQHSNHNNHGQSGARQAKYFLYLVQSDVCVDLAHLKSERSEVIQLVWKVPPEIDCLALYLPNSSLVQGRNRLYSQVLRSFPNTSFMFYIFMDGDVTLREVKDFGFNTGNPWLTFEEYLLEWKPAVGFPHFGAADYDEDSEVQVVFNFDQVVVAYHSDAAPLLLPYTEKFDSVSWWYCGTVQNALCAAVYKNHRMQFNALRSLSWLSNPSPTYLRATNFLFPLTWIGSAIKSLDLLMAIPWFGPFQSATSNLWDSSRRTWVMNGIPTKKGAVQYEIAGIDELDFCHEYFLERYLHRLCKPHESSRQELTPSLAILAHLKTIQSRSTRVETEMSELERFDLSIKAGQVAERANQLIALILYHGAEQESNDMLEVFG
jgi:hypothetical protein